MTRRPEHRVLPADARRSSQGRQRAAWSGSDARLLPRPNRMLGKHPSGRAGQPISEALTTGVSLMTDARFLIRTGGTPR